MSTDLSKVDPNLGKALTSALEIVVKKIETNQEIV